MVSCAPDWASFYLTLNINDEVNQKMNKIMEFNLSSLQEPEWISNLSQNPGLALLLVDGFGKLVLLHNLSYLQENIFCSESKILGLCGQSNKAEVYRIDSVSASSSLEFPVPSWRDLKGTQTELEVDALSVPDQNPAMAKFKNSLWIPPLVSNTIFDSKSLSPSILIPLLSTKFQEFDRSNTVVKACTILRPVLEYLWAVHKKMVPTTVVAVDSSMDASEWSSRFLFACISSSLPALPLPPFPAPPVPTTRADDPSMASSPEELRRSRDVAERQLLRDAQSADTKKDSNGWE